MSVRNNFLKKLLKLINIFLDATSLDPITLRGPFPGLTAPIQATMSVPCHVIIAIHFSSSSYYCHPLFIVMLLLQSTLHRHSFFSHKNERNHNPYMRIMFCRKLRFIFLALHLKIFYLNLLPLGRILSQESD